jgi:rod shape-determining protein MreD
MIDPVALNIWRGRALFLIVVLALMFARLLPLGSNIGRFPGPEWTVCIVFALMMRRPDYLPLWLLAGVMLLEDIVLMRPIGLWAALMVLAAEVVRSRSVLMRELSFLMEWAVISALMLGMLVIYRITFALTMLPQVSVGFALVGLIWSVIAYPAVVLISRFVLDLQKSGLGQIDAYGRRF